jgi:regulator of sirC expression with transglutaminase-like and TPR domain
MDLDTALARLAHDAGASLDLAELALHLAKDEYPDLDVEAYLGQLAGMAHEAGRYLRGDLPARVHGLCRYLFHDMGFRGNTQSYYDPRNSYLNDVLERRTGLPILLSTVAIAVGTRAGLEVVGIGLPGHFVVKAIADGQEQIFDPFHGGRQLDPEQCEILVHQVTGMDYKLNAAGLAPLPVGLIALRILNNLKGSYLRDGDFHRAIRVIERIRQLSPDDVVQRRDLGVSWVRVGQPGRALDHLQAYLDAVPEAEDAETVRGFLHEAKLEVAHWN